VSLWSEKVVKYITMKILQVRNWFQNQKYFLRSISTSHIKWLSAQRKGKKFFQGCFHKFKSEFQVIFTGWEHWITQLLYWSKIKVGLLSLAIWCNSFQIPWQPFIETFWSPRKRAYVDLTMDLWQRRET